MSIEVRVPVLPESVSEATVLEWHKKVGDKVSRDDNLVDLETEKVVLEVPAEDDGVLEEIRVESGATVAAQDIIAVIGKGDGASSGKSSAPASDDSAEREQPQAKSDDDDTDESEASTSEDDRPLSPAVRRLVAEHDIPIGDVPGSGRDGRPTKEDVLAFLKKHVNEEPDAPAAKKAPAPAPEAKAPTATGDGERREPMTRLRRTIAQRLVQVQQTAAILTTFNEVDLHRLLELRAKYRDAFEKRHGVRLGIMSFFVKAATEALKRFPVINAAVDGNDIVYHDYYDVGIAVAGPRGLVVPVLRNADRMSLADIEKSIAEFGTKARDGALSMDELSGGTFTITNGGVFGSMLSTPILNPPQSAILGMHATKERPVVVDGEIRIRPVMYLAVSYDHRIIDGRDAVQFLVAMRDALEDPARLLLEV